MAKRPLVDLIEEQNRLAQAKAPSRPFAVVRVLVAGRYNGPDLKSQRASVGDIIAVAAGQYAADIIRDDLVEIPVEEPESEDELTKESEEEPVQEETEDEVPVDDPKVEDPKEEPIQEESDGQSEDEPEDFVDDPSSDFAKMKVADLRSLASAVGIDPTGMKKAQLIEEIEALRRAS